MQLMDGVEVNTSRSVISLRASVRIKKQAPALKRTGAVSFVSERGDSNARPLRPERSALPTALLSDISSKVRYFL